MIKPTWFSTGLIAIIAGILFFLLGKGCQEEISVYAFNPQAELSEFESGYLVSQAKAQEATISTLKSENKRLLESLEVRRPAQVIKINTVARDTVILYKDTTASFDWDWVEDSVADNDSAFVGELYSYKDEWIEAVVRHYGFAVAMDYQVKDSISLVGYKDSGDEMIRAVSHNPNTTITGLDYKIPKKKVGIGFQSGVTWDGKVKPYIGVGISWNFVRF